MKVEMRSRMTNRLHVREIEITEEEWRRIQDGELVHLVVPHLSPGDREYLISGITNEEWESYFGKD